MDTKTKQQQRDRRRKRVRAKIFGTSEKPRLSVFRSNKHISAQIIDDTKGMTLVMATSEKMKGKGTLLEKALKVGQTLAGAALKEGVIKVVFDRGGFEYTGVVAALALGAREGGLKF